MDEHVHAFGTYLVHPNNPHTTLTPLSHNDPHLGHSAFISNLSNMQLYLTFEIVFFLNLSVLQLT